MKKQRPKMRRNIATEVVHGKQILGDPNTRALSVPIYQSAVFTFESAESGAQIFAKEKKGYFYTRLGNPTIEAFEEKMAYLEEGESACAFASGMAAISGTILSICNKGDEVIAVYPIYGCTYSLLVDVLPKWEIKVKWAKADNFLNNLKKQISSKTKIILIETPVNPTIDIVDIKETAKIAQQHKILLAVDNTFASFYNQKPLNLGADIVVYSATKYISGHGDTVGGVVIGKKDFIAYMKDYIIRDLGGIISPFNAWLLLRGLRTMAVRMQTHNQNGMAVAKFLETHPKVAWVKYPGLASHPQSEIAQKQMSGFSSMIAFELKGGRNAGRKLMNNVKLCVCAVSLGDCATLIEHPASMTHSSYSKQALIESGISEGLVRLSVGIEYYQDIIDDLRQALDKS
ncbi:MAG: aminotransferase class I/II-fold pyridoxal phosphate-dependent enzyme [candidate division WOR-3 bacterium]|nr:aminotransferase class I/II-fold pyridoxal phosphate-dependent enzyme [candidate division WOR-3 bacterium]